VQNWAGYVSVNGSQPTLKRHLWYWFFESRNAPSTDPLVIWLTGGPGCSSLVALFAENGPYIIAEDLSLSLNPFSWNSNASVIWIDQPVNTGYSYADRGDFGATSEAEIADNLYEFLQGFLSQYPKYSELPFYITGESYAGHYIPAAATRIMAGNADPLWPRINLQAIAIGNGLVDPAIQYTQYAPFAAATQVLPPSSIAMMEAGLPGCVAAINACAQNTTLGLEACILATEVCNLSQMIPFQLTGLNVYDVRIKCAVPPLCYNFSNVDAFLAQPEVEAALGVTGRAWVDCNRMVDLELIFAGDWMLNLATEVPALLASGVRVVVYSGQFHRCFTTRLRRYV
jgi:carboxypeptidase C (cathepsin A)